MKQEFLNGLQALQYADLGNKQEEELREMERKFNNEFGTEYYFMVMKKNRE